MHHESEACSFLSNEKLRCSIFYISAATIWLFAITATLLALIKVQALIH